MKFIKNHWLLFIGLILVLPTLWPLFRSDFFQMHDFTHVARLVELDLALKAGQFPSRWAIDFGWGYGMPLFHFYGPLPYYLAELLYLIKLPAVWAIKAVFALNYLLGFYFMYLWAKDRWGKLGGLVSAAAFVYLPYRAVQFYVRGSLAELTAMTFIPLFFYASQKKKVVLASLAWSAIFLSHNVIALFSLGFFGLYFLFNLKYWRRWLIVSGLTLVLTAWFIIPAFFEKDLTVVNSLTGGYSHYSLHFIYLRQLWERSWGYGGSIFGLEDNISFQLGWPQLLLILPAVFLWRRLLYVFVGLGLAVFMMTFHSQFIWDRLPILALAQFPWRLLAFAATFVAFFSGSLFYWIKNKFAALVLIVLIIALNWQYFRPEKFSPVNDYYYTDRQLIALQMSDILADYLPKTAKKPTQPRDINGPFNQFYFPGWQVKTAGQWVAAQLDAETGLIAGAGAEIKLTKTPLQFWSDIISLLSWIGLIFYVRTRP
ncbi:MAG: hypothetical protein NTZ93_02820 [Candidatus Beckwithbacteria bacterium]|nr:hypothetical protein [Candidatus Beckwithbacteria bacterium]